MSLEDELLQQRVARIREIEALGFRPYGQRFDASHTVPEILAAYGDKINAITVSLDLPFAMNRFCGAEGITSLKSVSDYQDRSFGQNWGMLIEELKILARGTFVLDANGKVVYAEQVKEVADEPNYDAALAALKSLV